VTRREQLITPAFVFVTVAGLCQFVSLGATLPVLPRYIEGPLGGGSIAVGFGVGAFAISAVVARPFLGRLGDLAGRRVLVVGGGLLLGAGTAGLAIFDSYIWLIAMRLVQGVGEAAQFVGAVTLVSDLAPEHRRGEATSYFSVAVYVGLGVGPLIGETVLDATSFVTVWLVAGGLSLAGALIGLGIPQVRPAHVPTRRRLIHPAGLGAGAVVGLGIMGLTAFLAFMPLHADDLGLDGARWVFAVYGGIVLLVRIFGATIPDRLGYVPTATVALAAIGAGLVLMGAWNTEAGLYAGTAIFAAGMSLLYPALMSLALAGVPEGERASVVGTFTAFFDVAQGLGGAALGVVAALSDYEGAFVVGGLLAASGILLLRSLAPRPEPLAVE
jgi:MFS family permease